jgi:hypothetical protein
VAGSEIHGGSDASRIEEKIIVRFGLQVSCLHGIFFGQFVDVALGLCQGASHENYQGNGEVLLGW